MRIALAFALLSVPSFACDFCMPAGGDFQSLQAEIAASDSVAIGRVTQRAGPTRARFRVERVLRGDLRKGGEQTATAPFFLSPDADYLLLGPKRAIRMGKDSLGFIEALVKQPKRRLVFYLPYLRHPDPLVAASARQEFAVAPYAEVKALRPKLDPKELLAWIDRAGTPAASRGILLLLIGISGNAEYAAQLETRLGADAKPGSDAVIAAFLMLRGEKGIARVEAMLVNSAGRERAVLDYLKALRFHEREERILPRARILASIRGLLRYPECAEATLYELKRLQDWSSRDAVLAFQDKHGRMHPWIAGPVRDFLAACPDPKPAMRDHRATTDSRGN